MDALGSVGPSRRADGGPGPASLPTVIAMIMVPGLREADIPLPLWAWAAKRSKVGRRGEIWLLLRGLLLPAGYRIRRSGILTAAVS